jgi:hypothetical protein
MNMNSAKCGGWHIRLVLPSDVQTSLNLRSALWPDGADTHASEIADFFTGRLEEHQAVLIALDLTHAVVGFVELSVRMDVPGLRGKRTGFVEGCKLFRQCVAVASPAPY